jgi:starch phosphorylase
MKSAYPGGEGAANGAILCGNRTSTEGLMTDRTIVEAVKKEYCEALFAALGRFPEAATPNDRYLALALAVRRQVMRRWVATSETYYKKASRTVCYLSAEFLLGPHLGNNLLNLGLQEEARQAMSEAPA